MNLVFEKLSQALAASESWRLNIAGDFFRLSEAAYPVSVSLLKEMRIVGTMRNMMAGDYVRDIAFDGVIIDNGATAQNVYVQIAGGGAGSDRVLGEVSVIDGAVVRTVAGGSFWGSLSVTGAAGNFPNVQFWNPAASGVRVVIEDIAPACSVSQPVKIGVTSAALANLQGCCRSKKSGGADSKAEIRYQDSAALLVTAATQLAAPYVAANRSEIYKLTSPVVLLPGYGLTFVGLSVACMVQGQAQFYEEAF